MSFSFRIILTRTVRRSVPIFAIVLALLPVQQAQAAEPHRNRSIIGKWKLTALLDFADVSALDDGDAKRLVGEVLIIGPDKLRLGRQVCSASDFQAERVEPNADLREKAHASAAKLGLPNPVTVVELSCAYVYIKDRNHIVLA